MAKYQTVCLWLPTNKQKLWILYFTGHQTKICEDECVIKFLFLDTTREVEIATAVVVMNITSVIPNSITTILKVVDIEHFTILIRQGENSLPTCHRDRASMARDIIDQIPSWLVTREISSSLFAEASTRLICRSGSATPSIGQVKDWRSCEEPGSMTSPGSRWTVNMRTG